MNRAPTTNKCIVGAYGHTPPPRAAPQLPKRIFVGAPLVGAQRRAGTRPPLLVVFDPPS